MRKVIREPLVHFLLLGAALFGVYFALNRNTAESPQDIVVTNGQIETIAIAFTRVWQRPPTQTELKGLIDNYVKEEILSREAVKLGLDQNDTVIRRRLQQKMEFIAEDFTPTGEPSDAQLAEYLAKHPEQFAQEQRFTFRQVYLNPEKHGDKIEVDFDALLTRLRQDPAADLGELGDRLLLPSEFTDEAQRDVAAQFGQQFAAELAKLKAGEWSGPVPSGYGVHLVLVTQRTEGRLPVLEDVRDQVARELIHAQRAEANQKLLDGLLSRYRITIQQPPPQPASAGEKTGMNE